MPGGTNVSASVNTCSGTFMDQNGNSNYSNNQKTKFIVCPDEPNMAVQVTFTSFQIEAGFDSLLIINRDDYTGRSWNEPNVMGVFWGTNNPGTRTSTHSSGCLTFYFSSDGTVTDLGWEATFTCVFTCTPECATITDVVLDANGQATLPADAAAGFSNCGAGVIESSPAQSVDCTNVGPNTVLLTVEDGNGNMNSAACAFQVVDNTAPNVVCAPIANIVLDGNGLAILPANAAAGGFSTDNCGTATESSPLQVLDCTNVGPNTVLLTVEDGNGNMNSTACAFQVVDNTAPNAVCAPHSNVVLDANGQASITARDIDNGSYDNCGIDGLSVSPNTFGCGNTGSNTVLLTVEDGNGNMDICAVTVTVEDNNAPTAICASPTVNLTSDGTTTVDAGFFDDGSSAVCGTVSFSASQTDFDCDDVGNTYNVTLTVTSQSSGKMATCVASVTVADPNSFCCAPPMAVCDNITVQLDASGQASITAADIGSSSTAECGLQSEMLSVTDFGCPAAGAATTVTYTITDVNGDSDDCTANVTVEDNIAPEAACLSPTVELLPDGTYSLQQSDVYDSVNSSDNCSTSSVSFPATTYTCDDAGQSFNVTVTVEDPSGNTDNCTATVSVEVGSSLPPEWSASDIGDPGDGSGYDYDPCAANNPDQGDFTISTGGYNLIPQNSDNLAFATVPLCGNGGIQARIESVSGGYGGLMIRESSAPGAKMVAVYSNLTNLLRRETRTVTNGPRSSGTFSAAFPKWLRLVRQGDLIRVFYRNSNGGSWILFHQAYVPMDNCVEMGLAVFTTDPGGDASAIFGKVNYQSQGGQSLSTPNTLSWEAERPEVLKASVLPNPVRGAFTLQFSKPLSTAGQAALLNEFGQRIAQQPLRAGEREVDWDASALPAGLYFLEVATEDGYREVLKVVRQ